MARWGLGKAWVAPESLPGLRDNTSVAGMVQHAPSFSVRTQAMVALVLLQSPPSADEVAMVKSLSTSWYDAFRVQGEQRE